MPKGLNKRKMKIILTLIYPIWFFLSKTWLGGVSLICLLPLAPCGVIYLLFPNIMDVEGSQALSGGIAIFSILIGCLMSIPVMMFGDYLKSKYLSYGYKVKQLY